MKFTKALKVKTALIWTLLAIIFVVGTGSFHSYHVINTYNKAISNIYDYPLQSVSSAQSAKYNLQRVFGIMQSSLKKLGHDEMVSKFDLIDEYVSSLRENLSVLVLSARHSDSKAYIEKVLGQLKSFDSQNESIKMELEDGNFEKAMVIFKNSKINKSIESSLYKLAEIEELYALALKEKSALRGQEIEQKVGAFYLFSIFIILLLFYLFFLFTVRPLSLAVGSFSKAILKHGENDEGLTELEDIELTFDSLIGKLKHDHGQIDSLLKTLPVGVFFFNADGNILPGRSDVAHDIMPELSTTSTMMNLFENHSNISFEKTEEAMTLIWDENRSLDFKNLSNAVLPSEITKFNSKGEKKVVHLSYSEHRYQGDLISIIVHIYDDTENLIIHDDIRNLASRIHQITRAGENTDSYFEFIKSTDRAIKSVEVGIDEKLIDLNSFKRDIHILKELFRMYEFYDCVAQIHELESFLDEGKENVDILRIESFFDSIIARFLHHKHTIARALNLDEERKYAHVSAYKLQKLFSMLRSERPYAELTSAVKDFSRFPAERTLSKYKAYVASISEKLKKPTELRIDSGSSELSYREVRLIDGTLGLLLTNCVDHGIEELMMRRERGKTELGNIYIKVKKDKDFIQVTIRDDGRGIDSDRLVQKAQSIGLWSDAVVQSSNEIERLMLIFEPNLSSKTDVEVFSGRGVGMDAAFEQISSLGGEITVDSVIGRGTTFSFFYRY